MRAVARPDSLVWERRDAIGSGSGSLEYWRFRVRVQNPGRDNPACETRGWVVPQGVWRCMLALEMYSMAGDRTEI